MGLEALSRGVPEGAGGLIPPDRLFAAARGAGIFRPFCDLCRDVAVRTFAGLETTEGTLLFLNFEASDDGEKTPDPIRGLMTILERVGLPPNHVAIEVLESHVRDLGRLRRMVDELRAMGCLIVLDDVGYGHSNLDRIPLIRPDVMKIDRGLIRDIEKDYHKQETFMALVHLARRIGALVVAEGVETPGEALTTLELGADLLQGFYLARPHGVEGLALDQATAGVRLLAGQFKARMVERISERRQTHRRYTILINEILCRLGPACSRHFDTVLTQLAPSLEGVECLYVLNEDGLQVTQTIFVDGVPPPRGIFRPAARGADHSLKEYYYVLLDVELQKYTTEPYVSMATGHVCRTISTCFRDVDNRLHILCVDVLARMGQSQTTEDNQR